MSCTPLRMIVDNQLDEFTLSASPALLPELPVNNILDDHRSYVARSALVTGTDDYQQIIRGTHSAGRTLAADGIAIARHNMTGADDSYRLVLRDGDAVVFDSGDIPFAVLIPLGIWQVGINWFGEPYDSQGLDNIKVLWFPRTFYTNFELTLTKRYFDHPRRIFEPWIDVGQVFLGLSISPEHNFSWGNELQWNNGQTYARTQGGSLVTEGGHATYRELRLSLNKMTDRDRNLLSTNLRRTAGQSVLVAAYPNAGNQTRETEYTLIAKVLSNNKWSHHRVGAHSTELNLLEI